MATAPPTSVDAQPPFYTCPECQLTYDEAQWAERCAAWCRAHHSCNLAITAHSREVTNRGKPQAPRDSLSAG
jgi:hypothetical protein